MTSDDAGPTEPSGVATQEPASDTTGRRGRKHLPIWQETILLLGIAVVLAILIKAVLVQAFYIPSESMEPGLVKDDRILVQKVSYWFGGSPERGDIVVFEDPGGWLGANENRPSSAFTTGLSKIGLYPTGGHLVKRVIGVEGDVIECCDEEGRILVNGVPLTEDSYVKPEKVDVPCRGPMTGNCEWTSGPVPDGHVFVMGDNRLHSADSSARVCTEAETDCVSGSEFVANDLVVGKVFALVWPRDRFEFVDEPDEVFADVPQD